MTVYFQSSQKENRIGLEEFLEPSHYALILLSFFSLTSSKDLIP